MENSAAKRKNPPVVETNRPVPIKGKDLDREIQHMRRQLQQMQEEPQKCRLLKKERENWDLGQDLDAMRLATRERLAQVRTKNESFEKHQNDLKNWVLSQESFIKDTDIKIERAEKKAKDEQCSCKKADEEMLVLIEDFKKLRAEKGGEIHKIRYHMHYKQFLAATASIYNSQKTSTWPKGEGEGATGNPIFITQ